MKYVRVGVFGLSRGCHFIKNVLANNGEIVAICDKNERRLNSAAKDLGNDVAAYSDFDSFIEHPMDAVVLANYFHEHTSFAIRCLEKGIHVLCECTAGSTLAECVELVRAAEKSDAIYMLAENYPYMNFNREIKRVYEGGTLGKAYYAEGEYCHAGDPYNYDAFLDLYDPDEKHWRFHLSRTYYITHSLAPIAYATGAMPIRVTAMPVYFPGVMDNAKPSNCADKAAIITTLNDDNSVFRVTGNAGFGGSDNSYRICCKNGQIENVRGSDGKIMLRYDGWYKPEDMETVNYYLPDLHDPDAKLIKEAGHGGGDFCVVREFLNCIKENRKPDFDVYFATRLSAVAIMAHRSMLEYGVPYDVPDFRKEEDRVKYENDTLSPFWYSDGTAPTLPCCSNPEYKASKEQIENFYKVYEEKEKNQKKV